MLSFFIPVIRYEHILKDFCINFSTTCIPSSVDVSVVSFKLFVILLKNNIINLQYQ